MYDITYMWNLKNTAKEWIQQKRSKLIDTENKPMVSSGGREGWQVNRGAGREKGYYVIIWNQMYKTFENYKEI